METKTGFAVTSDGLRIHYASSASWDEAFLPIIFVPGMLGVVDFYEREVKELGPLRVTAFSHRGLGESDIPPLGLSSFASRCNDIAAVVSATQSKHYALCGFSRGVAMCVQHALNFPHEVKALILIDCEPQYVKFGPEWLTWFRENRNPQFHLETLERYSAESENIDLTECLSEIKCPTLIVRGEKPASLLSAEKASEMSRRIKQSSLLVLPNSGHELAAEDFELFKNSVQKFLGQIKEH